MNGVISSLSFRRACELKAQEGGTESELGQAVGEPSLELVPYICLLSKDSSLSEPSQSDGD